VYGPLPSNGCFSASTVLALSKYAIIHTEFWSENVKERDHLDDPSRRRWENNIKIHLIEKGNMGESGLDSFDSGNG
jgi:hypothetical protein